MRPAPFAYERVESVEEMLEALARADGEGAAVLLAGGQSLIPRLNARLVRPRRVIDIDGIAALDHLELDQELRVGALCRHWRLEEAMSLDGPWAALRGAAAHVGLHPVRTRGTFGGSLAHADPAAELPLAAVAYGAEIELRSRAGQRRVAAEEFFRGPHRTALGPGEAIVGARFPSPKPDGVSAFAEVSRRVVGWPLAAVCVVLHAAEGVIQGARVGLGAVGPAPRRAIEAERLLEGSALESSAIDAAAVAAARACAPAVADGVDEDTRRDMVEALVRRTLAGLAGAVS